MSGQTIVRVRLTRSDRQRVEAARGPKPISTFLREQALQFAQTDRAIPLRPVPEREEREEIVIAFRDPDLDEIEKRRGGIARAVFVREAALAQISS